MRVSNVYKEGHHDHHDLLLCFSKIPWNEGKLVVLRLALGNDHMQLCVQPGYLHYHGDNHLWNGHETDTAFLARRTVDALQQWTERCHNRWVTEMIWDRHGTG